MRARRWAVFWFVCGFATALLISRLGKKETPLESTGGGAQLKGRDINGANQVVSSLSPSTTPVYELVASPFECSPPPEFLAQPRLFADAEVTALVLWLEACGLLRGAARYVVDFGANDGHGPTEALLASGVYGGLLVEGDASHNVSLHALFPAPSITKAIAYVYPHTALDLLHRAGAPMGVQLFKIDMDADDCATIFTLLDGGFQPRVLQLEFDYDLPYPWAFAVLPLSAYSYTSHYGFQSCSLAFAVELLLRFGYKLVSVGGTKDALFCHESAMAGGRLRELDARETSYAFSTHAILTYSANPSNARQFEVEGRVPAAIAPSQFFAVDPALLTHDIMAQTMNASCVERALNAKIVAGASCPFPYVLSVNPASAVDAFIRAIKGGASSPSSP